MESPPIQCSMARAVETCTAPKRKKMAALTLLALFLFAIALIVFAYSIPNPPPKRTQASAATLAKFQPAYADIALAAKSAYVLDMQTGVVLFAKNQDVQLSLASLTKVLLALVVSEVLDGSAVVTVPYGVASNITLAPFQTGDTWRVRDMLDYTLTASNNGGAEVLARAADPLLSRRYPQAGDERTTLWRMNDIAHSLGLEHTYFLNVSGLDLSTTESGAYGSARDVARLFAFAAKYNVTLFESTTKPDVAYTSTNGKKISASNTDEAVGDIPGLIMGKTGFTDLAGGNLAVVFNIAPEHPIVAVVLGSTVDGRFTDIKKLVAAAQETAALIR